MQEELITFQVAKLAKEKGFDLRQDITYILESSDEWYESKGITQSLLQKWLREKYNIILTITYFRHLNKYCYAFSQFSILSKNYDTYEEALEEGLYEALKLIPNTNSGN